MISQYDKLTKEYAELCKAHASLKEKKQQWRGKVEQDSNTRIADHMRGSTVEISSINASLGGDGSFLANGVMMFLEIKYTAISSAVSCHRYCLIGALHLSVALF
jgi:hypothetical protein